jgi:transglutaminase-like putative cysteine protease
MDVDYLKASHTLEVKSGYCVSKAVLLAAVCRSVGIPARLGFADVRNHFYSTRLKNAMGTDLFVYHGYVDLFLNRRWVKATPAFNGALCERFGVIPLEFDGVNDSLFQPFDTNGNKHMEYVTDHGVFGDVPFNEILDSFKRYYPKLFEKGEAVISGDFAKEARPVS